MYLTKCVWTLTPSLCYVPCKDENIGTMDVYPHFDVMDIIYFDKNMDKKQKLFKFKSLIFYEKPKRKKTKKQSTIK